MERIRPWLEHLKRQCGAGDGSSADDDVYRFYIRWQAHIVQRPWVKQPVAVLLTGKQGTGKGFVVQMLRRIIGDQHFLQFTNMEGLTHFQSPKDRTNLLTVMDELELDPKKLPDIKALITEEFRQYNEKYLPQKTIRSFANYMFLSNSETAIPVIAESDRRLIVLKADDTLAGTTGMNPEYWNALHEVHPADVACFLFSLNLSEFNPASQLPGSKPKLDMKIKSSENQVQWLHHELSEGPQGCFSGKDQTKEAVYRSYCDYAAATSVFEHADRSRNSKRASPKMLDATRFWAWMQHFFRELEPHLKDQERRVRNSAEYVGQKVIVRLWPFEQARKVFCAYFQDNVEWSVDHHQPIPMDNESEAADVLHTPIRQAVGTPVVVQHLLPSHSNFHFQSLLAPAVPDQLSIFLSLSLSLSLSLTHSLFASSVCLPLSTPPPLRTHTQYYSHSH
jgi:hypothetical protein